MNVQVPCNREEDRDVHPAKVIPVAPTRGCLDDSLHRSAPAAGGAPVGRRVDLGHCHRRRRDRGSDRFLVAKLAPRVLVKGGGR